MSRGPLFALLALLSATGCMTMDTLRNPGYDGPRVYSGTRKNLHIWPNALIDFNLPFFLLSTVDFPLSLIGDTVMLPVTIPQDSERAAKDKEERRVDVERVAAISPREGESAAATAHRLFTACAKLLHEKDPHFADCYSIGAKVEITGSDPVTGAEYKPELRDGLERWRSAGETLEWRDPSFAEDGGRVRISVKRAVSTNGTRLPVSLIVGPSSDGGWRILEEIGPGLTEP